MSVKVDPERLGYELAVRGLSATDLSRRARLSPATVSAALSGRPISATSLRLIAKVLVETPVDTVISQLLPTALRARNPLTAALAEERA